MEEEKRISNTDQRVDGLRYRNNWDRVFTWPYNIPPRPVIIIPKSVKLNNAPGGKSIMIPLNIDYEKLDKEDEK